MRVRQGGSSSSHLLYPALLLILATLRFAPLWSCTNIFVERDLSSYFIPPRYAWVGIARSFEFPLWNPYNFSGIPLLATLQPGVLYPPNLFFLFLPFNIVWNWLIILHFFFAGFSTYLFLRYLHASRGSAFVGGCVFMLSGYLLSLHNVLPHLFSAAWFPLVIMFFLRHLETHRNRDIILCALFLAMQFLSGAPEMVAITLTALVVFALFPKEPDKSSLLLRFRSLAFVAVLFLAISSVQALPFLEMKSLSIRSEGLSYREAVTWSLSWKDLARFFLHDPFGLYHNYDEYWTNQAWLKSLYLGIGPFVLAAVFFAKMNRQASAFLLLIAVSLVLALGGNTPLYKLLYRLPVFDSLRYPVKFLFLFFFIVSVAAGLGFDMVRRREGETVKVIGKMCLYFSGLAALTWSAMYVFSGGMQSLLAFLAPDFESSEVSVFVHNLKRFLLFSLLFSLLFFVASQMTNARTRNYLLFLLMTLLALDLYTATNGFYRFASWEFYLERHAFLKEIKKEAGVDRYVVNPEIKSKVIFFPYNKLVLDDAFAAVSNTYSGDGQEVLRLKEYDTLLNMAKETVLIRDAKKYFDIMGIKHVVTWKEIKDDELRKLEEYDMSAVIVPVGVKNEGNETATARRKKSDAEKMVEALSEAVFYLYRYDGFNGRYFLAPRVHFLASDKALREKLRSGSFDQKQELLISAERNEYRDYGPLTAKVSLVSYTANIARFEYTSNRKAFFYLSDTYYPGWKAYIDGKKTKIHRANLTFRAVEVPEGAHELVFRYTPVSFYGGLVITILGIFLCVCVWMREQRD